VAQKNRCKMGTCDKQMYARNTALTKSPPRPTPDRDVEGCGRAVIVGWGDQKAAASGLPNLIRRPPVWRADVPRELGGSGGMNTSSDLATDGQGTPLAPIRARAPREAGPVTKTDGNRYNKTTGERWEYGGEVKSGTLHALDRVWSLRSWVASRVGVCWSLCAARGAAACRVS
jgi:hypothetical protein